MSDNTIPGTDEIMDGHIHLDPLPQPGPNWSDADKWLPKTDWSRDGIIASDD